MKSLFTCLLGISLISPSIQSHAQNSEHYGSGLKLNLNQEGNKYVRFLIWNQIWARHIENNPGTLVNGVPSESTQDIGARRLRMLAYAQISPRYLIVTHFGINNQTFVNGGGSGTSGTGGYGQGKKPQIFFHDAYNEYAIITPVNPITGKKNNFTLSLGAGLHYWNGVSRMSSASTLTFLMIDAPVFNWPLIENGDQFARQYGLYVKGTYKKLHYQFHLNKPFATNIVTDSSGNAVDNNSDAAGAPGGYVEYQFLEQESNLLPFRVGTYIGGKKVFNIGAGFYHQNRGTRSYSRTDGEKKYDITLLSGDVFLDMPIGDKKKNMAITAYAVYYNFDYGPNYLRNTGIMNPGTTNPAVPATDRVLEGPGNARVLLGTGDIFYAQAGFLLPKFGEHNKIRLQPIASVAYKDMDALNAAGTFWDAGCNFYIDAHNAKITAQYSSRPLYDIATREIQENKGEVLVQFQICL